MGSEWIVLFTVGYELGYSGGHVMRQPDALIGRRCYDEDADWRGAGGYMDENAAGDVYRSAMAAYRCRLGPDWELAEPLSYNSRPPRYFACDRYVASEMN